MDKIKPTILGYLENKDWIFGGQLARDVAGKLQKKESNIERRCRELENEGKLERQMVQVNGKGNLVVQYKLKIKEKLF